MVLSSSRRVMMMERNFSSLRQTKVYCISDLCFSLVVFLFHVSCFLLGYVWYRASY